MTQHDAAVKIYRMGALALGDPDVLDPDADDAYIINWFMEKRIFNSSGPNEFIASERLTNRLAMIRTVRFFLEVAMNYFPAFF